MIHSEHIIMHTYLHACSRTSFPKILWANFRSPQMIIHKEYIIMHIHMHIRVHRTPHIHLRTYFPEILGAWLHVYSACNTERMERTIPWAMPPVHVQMLPPLHWAVLHVQSLGFPLFAWYSSWSCSVGNQVVNFCYSMRMPAPSRAHILVIVQTTDNEKARN